VAIDDAYTTAEDTLLIIRTGRVDQTTTTRMVMRHAFWRASGAWRGLTYEWQWLA